MATTVDMVKTYLRVSGTDEDALIATLLAAAQADALSYLGTPVVAAERTEKVDVGRSQTYLRLSAVPIDTTASITITDPDGDTWDPDAFAINAGAGLLATGAGTLAGRVTLEPGTWTVTYTGGLSVRHDYAEAIAPTYDLFVLLRTADLYLNRNIRAASESDGDTAITSANVADIADTTGLARYRRVT